MAFTAKYPGVCTCRAEVTAGSVIEYRGGKITGCPACKPDLVPATPKAGSHDSRTDSRTHSRSSRGARTPVVLHTYSAEALADLRERLDPEQRAVSLWTPADGNARIVAAAGSGKTTTVTALVANLVSGGHVAPAGLIVTTFTRKAADELRQRLSKVVPAEVLAGMQVDTFHGIASRALRARDRRKWDTGRNVDGSREARAPGVLGANLLWMNACSGEKVRLLPSETGIGAGPGREKDYTQAVDIIRAAGIKFGTPEAVEAAARMGLPDLYRAWSLYERQKEAQTSFDFADTLDAFLDVAREGAGGYVCIVDEAQDNSTVQIEIARTLAGATGRVLLVGDVRQSIYEWRGAAPQLFLSADRMIGAQTAYLPTNYRSGRKIVELGNAIAAGKPWSLGPAARSFSARGDGEITLDVRGTPHEVARATAHEIATDIREDSLPPKDVAILCRTRAMQGGYEAELLMRQVPVAIVGASSFFDSRTWRDWSALVQVVYGTADADALKRVVAMTPACGSATSREVLVVAETTSDPIAAIEEAATRVGAPRAREALRSLAGWLRHTRQLHSGDLPAIARACSERLSGSVTTDETDDDAVQGYTLCAELAASTESLPDLLAFAEKCAGNAQIIAEGEAASTDRVCISTVHRAKGREWRRVYVDATEGIFPHARCIGDEKRESEEERLFYVAVTRAAEELRVTAAATVRGRDAGPSVFCSYLPDEGGPDDDGPDGGDYAQVDTDLRVEVDALLSDAERAEGFGGVDKAPVNVVSQVLPAPMQAPARTVDAMHAALLIGLDRAETLTRAADERIEGQRFVTVRYEAITKLLEPFGFREDLALAQRARQRVLVSQLAKGEQLVVYTTVPPGADEARGLGEDSIKVTLLNFSGRPLAKRQPYAARTVNWRRTLLTRLAEVLAPHCTTQVEGGVR